MVQHHASGAAATTSEVRGKSRHFTDLDGIRGVLAVIVMLFHLGLTSLVTRLSGGLLVEGQWEFCVDFFFVLSGFVLLFSMERTRPGLGRYFEKRLFRLAPVFLLSTLAMLALAPSVAGGVTILANLLMVQSFVPGMLSINFPAWSIPFELFLPALVIPLLSWVARCPRRVAIGILVILLIADAWAAHALALGEGSRLLRALLGLATGMTLGMIGRLGLPERSRPLLVVALAGIAVGIMAVANQLPIAAIAFHPVAVAAIWFGAHTRSIFSMPPAQALGRWSYSIYLLHIPALTLTELVFGSASGSFALKGFIIVLTLAASAAMFRWVEAPLMRRSFRAPAQTAP